MPGITGLITKQLSGNEKEKVDTMLQCMLHESFYTHGTYQSPENGFFLGFSAIENSFADCMPIFNETKDVILFLTGETYHDRSDIDTLVKRGHNFSPQNASCLVHMYEEEGENLVRNLNGWFNGIILDLRSSKMILFNDRYGIRRTYYYEGNNFFAFSTEAKSLLKAFPELREISFQGIGEALTRDCVLGNRTYFPKINLLPPCSAWTFQLGHAKKKAYFDMAELENQPSLPKEQFIEKLESTFIRILPRYFSNGPVGLSLTGGLDTRLILACMNPDPGQLPCYTFTGTYRDIMDARLAPKVAATCGQEHTTLRLDDKLLLKEYPFMVERAVYIADGLECTDKTDVLYLNKMAREIAPVRMTGKYATETLKAGTHFSNRPPDERLINEDFKQYLDMANKTATELLQMHKLTFLLQGSVPWWWNHFVTLEASQIETRSPFLDNDYVKVAYQAPFLDPEFGAQFEVDLIAKKKPELRAIPTNGSYGGDYPWPIPNFVKMAFNLLDLCDKVYIRERLPFKMTHFFAKMDYRVISPLHLDRLVMGFKNHRRHRTWFRDELSGYLQDILLDNKTLNRPYWNKANLTKMVNDHIHGKGTYLREIRKVLQLELIHRVLLERI